MQMQELPDLSGWRFVEVWTLEEAAMLWAAIDPADHLGARLEKLKNVLPKDQFKWAWIARRAFVEAVCSGTLPFVDAWELHEAENGFDCYEKHISFPDLPSPTGINTHKTRVRQPALIAWAKGKQPTYRMKLKEAQRLEAIPPTLPTPTKQVLIPSYTTPALELLNTHIEQNLAGVADAELMQPSEQKAWLKHQGERAGLGTREIDAVYTVARHPMIKTKYAKKGVQVKCIDK